MATQPGLLDPPEWTEDDFERDRARAIEQFRKERVEEPLEDYLEAFDDSQGRLEELFETTVDLTQLEEHALAILSDSSQRDLFRYLAGPPISEDDLKTVADVTSLVKSRLEKDPDAVKRLVETVRVGLDRRRFPWIMEDREATEAERLAAVVASAALIATRRTETQRRSTGKSEQERRVQETLTAVGFTQVASRTISTLTEAPGPGEFCPEAVLGTRKADLVVRLWDSRVLPIECKVSNSSTNSIKRLNNDAAVKAVSWISDFGTRQVVPAAVLSGVFKLKNLRDAQSRGLGIFWAHDLKALTDWIEKTRPPGR